MRNGVFFLLLLLLLAFVLGIVIAGQGPSLQYRIAVEQLKLSTAARLASLKVVFWYVLAGIALLGMAFGLGVTIWSVWRRSQLIHPNASGLFPVVRGRASRQIYYHDPNRQLAGTVAYGAGPDGVQMQQLIPAGAEAEPFGSAQDRQLQVTTQAQVVQVVAAASQGGRMSAATRRLVERMTQQRPVPRLPEVQVVEGEIADPEARYLVEAIRQDWREE